MDCPGCGTSMAKDGTLRGKQRWRCTNPECPVKTRLEVPPKPPPKTAAQRFKEWYDRTSPEERKRWRDRKTKKPK